MIKEKRSVALAKLGCSSSLTGPLVGMGEFRSKGAQAEGAAGLYPVGQQVGKKGPQAD